jgi:4-carboxymuconolactone decarboxylase
VTQPRIPAQPSADWTPEVFEALSVLRPAAASIPPPEERPADAPRPSSNIVGIFSWHPELAKAWFLFNNHLFRSTLSDRVRELVTIRIAWLRGAEYEWAQHVKTAKAVGMSDAEIAAISVGSSDPIWGAGDTALLRAVDQLGQERYIEDALWTELAEDFDRQQLMDLVFTVGAYDLLCTATNTFGLEMDPGLQGFPDLD